MFLEIIFGILGDGLLPSDALGDLAIEVGVFAVLLAQDLLDIAGAVARELLQADQRVIGHIREIVADMVGERGAQRADLDQVPARHLLPADGAHTALLAGRTGETRRIGQGRESGRRRFRDPIIILFLCHSLPVIAS